MTLEQFRAAYIDANHALQKHWGAAKDRDDYNKAKWRDLVNALDRTWSDIAELYGFPRSFLQ